MNGIERLGATLLHFLWQGSLIAAVYATVRRYCSRPEGRYLMACVALFAMAVSPIATWVALGTPSPEPVLVTCSPALPPASAAPGFHSDLAGLLAAEYERG